MTNDRVRSIAAAVAAEGGLALLVGGCVRDRLLGSVQRRDSKSGTGHKGFMVEPDPTMSVADAARRRDFTINAILLDPRTDRILDPFGGRHDLERWALRAIDPETFVEDPLRAMRGAQFVARFELTPDDELIGICHGIRHELGREAVGRMGEAPAQGRDAVVGSAVPAADGRPRGGSSPRCTRWSAVPRIRNGTRKVTCSSTRRWPSMPPFR